MKKILALSLLLLFAFSTNAQENNSLTTYYFIRHAEKDKSDKDNKNPNLIMEGILRAAKWSMVFENVPFDAIYSTDYNRTKQTAQPTAEKKGLEVQIYDPRQLYSDEFAQATKGKKVLVVGHSNTTPAFVNTILKERKYPSIDENNNANLYIVTISSSGEKSDVLLVVE
jgi:broad specificity phosphatase PhoE